jgi:RecA-family ATPase
LEIDELEFEDYKWHCNSFIPIIEGKLIMVTGRGASGKGIAMFRTALQFLEENPTKKALLWNMEDNVNDIKIRLNVLSKNGLIITDDVKGRLEVKDTPKNIELSNLRHYFKDYDLVVVDPVSYLMDGDENDSKVVRPVMKLFQGICDEENKTIIMVHHEAKGTNGKGTKQARGSSAFFDNSRLSYSMRYEEGGEYHVDTVKNNYGENRENFTIDPWFLQKSSVIPFPKLEELDADVFNGTWN